MDDESWIIHVMSEIIRRKAVNPAFGGEGEKERADYIEKLLLDMGFEPIRYDTQDKLGLTRSSIIVETGEGPRMWFVAHIDTVGLGEGWKHDPFKLTVVDSRVFGRGVSDNGIGIISQLLMLRHISSGKIKPKYRVAFAFVADEESGSTYGIKYLLSKGIFRKNDTAIVPDFGNKDGSLVEIAEKGILWLKMITKGKQGHASLPNKADNANLKASKLIVKLHEKLHKKFNSTNTFFDPPYSTFEPTKRETNVKSINIIPGKDITYWDCRILPEYSIDEVLAVFREEEHDVEYEVIMREEASYTAPEESIVKAISQAIKEELNIEPKLIGIGGGTIAGVLRKAGIPAVAWSINSETEHKPDEYEEIDNYIKTAKVFERLVTSRITDE